MDYVEKDTLIRPFAKDSIVLRLCGQFIDQTEHLKRYKKKTNVVLMNLVLKIEIEINILILI